MNNKEFLNREIQILKQVPENALSDFIERNGERMREILEDEEWKTNLEIVDSLLKGYRGI